MKSKVLIPFNWYPNGYTMERVEAGDVRDFGANTDGLTKNNLIEPIGAVESIVDAVVSATKTTKTKTK